MTSRPRALFTARSDLRGDAFGAASDLDAAFAADGPSGVRRAAVYAHALPSADRAWLLAALEPTERATLAPLLAELDGLVAARPSEAHPAVGAAAAAPAVVPSQAPERGPRDRLAHDLATRPSRDLAARLAAEPDDVVRLVLALAPAGNVRDRVWGSLPAERRPRLGRSDSAEPTPARAAALAAAWTSTAWAVAPTATTAMTAMTAMTAVRAVAAAHGRALVVRAATSVARLVRAIHREWEAAHRAALKTIDAHRRNGATKPADLRGLPWPRRAARRPASRPGGRA